jgi:hypothetical protein
MAARAAVVAMAAAWTLALACPAASEGPASPHAAPAAAREPATAEAPSTAADAICLLIEAAAGSHGLPVPFFTRLIGQESSFRADVEGPVTRSGDRAQGIAQFMPKTAAERGLLDPFDPVQALPRSADFLRELKDRFGNWGLAAAAYNAGPNRVQAWLDGTGGLPFETRNYVERITGHPAEDWAAARKGDMKTPDAAPTPNESCETVRAMLRTRPNTYVAALQRRVLEGAARPWGVQLSAGFSRAQALTIFSRAEKRFASILAGKDTLILRSSLRSRGTRAFYQVRVGESSRQAADALCERLRGAGGACMVLRNALVRRSRSASSG